MNKSQTLDHIKKAFILSFLIIAFSNPAKLQNTTVVTIEPYKPSISDAFKINENPKITDTTTRKTEVNYDVSPKLFPTTFSVDPIKPAKVVGDPLVKLYKGYIKAGFGNKTTPYGEIYFNNLRSTEEAIGVYYRHLSSSGKIKDYGFPGFSDNEAAIFASKYYKNHTLTGEVDYNRNVVHYYGYNSNDFPGIKNDSLKQCFNHIAGQLRFNSTFRDSSHINHSFFIKYSHLSDLLSANEDNVLFKGEADKKVKFFGKSVEAQYLGLKANVDYYNESNSINNDWGAVILLLPHYSASYDVIKFDVGCNFFVKAAEETKLKPFPDLHVSIDLYRNVFILFADITNDLQRNSLNSLSNENPFINTSKGLDTLLNFTHTSSKFNIGFKGSLNSNLSYYAYLSEAKIDNLPLFVNDTTINLRNKFTLIYDEASVLNTHAEIAYQKSEKFNAMLILNYTRYSMKNELYAWHRPATDVKFAFKYNLKNKIILKADVFAYSSSYAKTFDTGINPTVNPVLLKGTVDFNLGLEYRYSKILSAFLNFNNVGAVRYKQWYNYPDYGFNVLAGISYAF